MTDKPLGSLTPLTSIPTGAAVVLAVLATDPAKKEFGVVAPTAIASKAQLDAVSAAVTTAQTAASAAASAAATANTAAIAAQGVAQSAQSAAASATTAASSAASSAATALTKANDTATVASLPATSGALADIFPLFDATTGAAYGKVTMTGLATLLGVGAAPDLSGYATTIQMTNVANTAALATAALDAKIVNAASLPAPTTLNLNQIIVLCDPSTGTPTAKTTLSKLLAAIQSGSSPSLSLSVPSGTLPNTAYTIVGSYLNYSGTPTLTVSIDSGAFGALPSGSTVSNGSISLAMPGVAAGTHTVQVKDSGGVLSNAVSFAVTPPATLSVATPSAQVTGTAFTVSGTYANATPSTLDYSSNDGSTWTLATGVTIGSGAYSFPITLSAVNAAQTIRVRDHNAPAVAGVSGSFAVTAPPAALQPDLVTTGASYAAGKFGNALIGGKGAATLSVPAGSFAFSCWVKAASPPPADFVQRAIITLNGTDGICLSDNGTGNALIFKNGGGANAGVNICDGIWHHLAYQNNQSGAECQMFVDGICVTGFGGPTPIGTTLTLVVAAAGSTSALPSTASSPGFMQIDDLALYSGVKFPSSTNFAVPTARVALGDAGLVGLYRLDGSGVSS